MLVQSALPVWRRRRRCARGQLDRPWPRSPRSAGGRPGPPAASAYLARLTSRLGRARRRPDRDALAAALGALAAADPELGFGAWHGDWTGWNIASTAARAAGLGLGAVHPDVPLGFDALHSACSPPWSAGAGHRRPRRPRASPTAPATLAPFGVPADEARLTALLYLVELAVRYLADRQAEAGNRLGRPAAG